jgi:uncharacterized protein YlxW (UPF0749 family)
MSVTQNRQANGTTQTTLESENAHLRDRLRELETELSLERKKRVELQVERDDYQNSLLAWSRAQISKEELHRWATEIPSEADSVPFEEIMAQLRKVASTP